MARTAIASLSTANLLHNLHTIRQQAPYAKIIAMVKANAYGHGLRSTSLRLQEHVDLLGVASIDEALALRKAGVSIPILLMEGVFEPEELVVAATEGFHVVLHEHNQLQWLYNASLSQPLYAWLKIDTGMGRLGFSITDGKKIYQELSQNTVIRKPLRIMSHLACADDTNNILNQQQQELFKNFIVPCTDAEFSLCNSAGIFNFPASHYHFVRPGLAMFGVSPFNNRSATDLNLKPVMTLKTSLIAIKHMTPGAAIGYGARFICPEAMPIGIVAFGYGDGYPRTAQDGTPILVDGVRCKLIGRVSMDMLAVDLRAQPTAKVGAEVVLWGKDLLVEEVATHTANSVYDLLTGVQNRVRFRWC